MKRTTWAIVALLPFVALVVSLASGGIGKPAAAQDRQTQAREVPKFQVDPSWPKLPSKWVLGVVSGVNVDAQDNIWVLHRPRDVKPELKSRAAPPVLEFDAAGNFIQGWGGPGEGYEWPGREHGISIDYKGNVWIGGSGTGRVRENEVEPNDDQILKFTNAGKFVMQIGHSGQSKGNADPNNVHGPADVTVYPKTNEVFVADGYGNRRIIVFDADTGAFKRMWGAFGNVPTDPPPSSGLRRGPGSAAATQYDEGPGPPQFNNVHSARVSNDGLVYVSDRAGKRVQVFTLEGKYLTQVFLSRGKMPPSTLPGMAFGKPIHELADGLANDGMTASRTAFSADPQQRFLYVIDRIKQQIVILDRKTLEILGAFGDGPGSAPGQFYVLHDVATDSKGNVYTAEVRGNFIYTAEVDLGNRRAQKFVFKGMSPATSTK